MRITLLISALLLFCLTFWSCEENIDSVEIITVTEEPALVSTTVIKGKVLDVDGLGIPEADVLIYHNLLTHQLITDDQGEYEVVFPKDSEKIHLSATANNFHNSSFDIAHLDHDEINKDFILAGAEDLPYGITNSVALVDSMFLISGQVLFDDGSPQSNALILLFDPIDNFLFSYAQTDENGFYSFAYEPFDSRNLLLLNECNSIELIGTIALIDQDLDLGSFVSSSSPSTLLQVEGSVIDCNTEEYLEFGEVTVSISGSSVTGQIIDGYFSVDIVDCYNTGCYDIQISSPTLIDGEIYEPCQDISNDQSPFEEYTLCGDPIIYTGEITLAYDNVNLVFDVKAINFPSGFTELFVQGNTADLSETIEFRFPLLAGPDTPIDYFNYAQYGETVMGHNEETGMITNFEIDGDTIEGQFSGPTLDINNTSVNVTGQFLITVE